MNLARCVAFGVLTVQLAGARPHAATCAAQELPHSSIYAGEGADPAPPATAGAARDALGAGAAGGTAGEQHAAALRDGYAEINSLASGIATPFARLQALGEQLLQRFPAPEDQAQIHYRLACAFAMGGAEQAARTTEHAKEALKGLRSPVERVHAYSYWGDAVAGVQAPTDTERRSAGELFGKALAELAKEKLPAVAPELPAVPRVDASGAGPDQPEYRAVMQEHARQVAARNRADEIGNLITERDGLIGHVACLYRAAPRSELRAIIDREIHDQAAAASTWKLIERQLPTERVSDRMPLKPRAGGAGLDEQNTATTPDQDALIGQLLHRGLQLPEAEVKQVWAEARRKESDPAKQRLLVKDQFEKLIAKHKADGTLPQPKPDAPSQK